MRLRTWSCSERGGSGPLHLTTDCHFLKSRNSVLYSYLNKTIFYSNTRIFIVTWGFAVWYCRNINLLALIACLHQKGVHHSFPQSWCGFRPCKSGFLSSCPNWIMKPMWEPGGLTVIIKWNCLHSVSHLVSQDAPHHLFCWDVFRFSAFYSIVRHLFLDNRRLQWSQLKKSMDSLSFFIFQLSRFLFDTAATEAPLQSPLERSWWPHHSLAPSCTNWCFLWMASMTGLLSVQTHRYITRKETPMHQPWQVTQTSQHVRVCVCARLCACMNVIQGESRRFIENLCISDPWCSTETREVSLSWSCSSSQPFPPPPLSLSLRFRKVFLILWVSLYIVAWHRSKVV